ncbi:MAG: hypothetical protein PHQ69_11325, partial [Bacteroidales bacterium]|nr:hypothetical protein [Bacteroidales bacterium]
MNIEYLLKYNSALLALFGGLFTYSITALGAAMVFFFNEIRPTTLNLMLGLAAGIRIAATVWSLLLPAIEMSDKQDAIKWLPATIGFLTGGAFLVMTVIPLLPYALSFAAGAMIFVVVEELIPESQRGNETDYSTIGAMIG